MKIRLAAIALIVVGVGAVALVVVRPTFGGSSSSEYITSTVSTGTVSATSVATGTVAASTVYGLKFGATADIVSTAATTSGSGGTTSSSSSSSLTWPVQTVAVSVGQSVTKGTVIATADATAAQLALASAQATLASAQSKLATDQGGPTALTLAQAKNQLNQSYSSYEQAQISQANTAQKNALSLTQAQNAVTTAQDQLTADWAASPPIAATIAKDQAALTSAQQNLTSTQLSISQSNQQAAQSVANASLSYQAAELSYQSQTSSASTATIQADQAAVAAAQSTVNADQAAVSAATLTAPADGLIVAVNILPGVNAPTSGYAIEESVGPMVANASFAESVVAGLKVGQTATVTVNDVSVPGTLTQIVPVATSSSGGISSSVATYAVTVTLTSPPATVLAGMSASVTVTTAEADNVLRVPATALQGSASAGYSVLVMNSDGSTTSRTVQVGLVTTSMAQITSGLSAGDTVVTGTVSNKNTTTTTTAGGAGGINSLPGGGVTGPGGGFGP